MARSNTRGRKAPITRLIPVASALLLALALLAGCTGGDAAAKPEGVVRFPISGEPDSLSYVEDRDLNSQVVLSLVGDALFTYDENLELVPRIAKSYTWSDDGLVLSVELRDDFHWHDGPPVTAEDVVYTFETFKKQDAGRTPRVAFFEPIVRVEMESDTLVHIHHEAPYASALGTWAGPLLPAHRPIDDPEVVGCGPWKLGQRSAERLELVANSEHPVSPPKLERLVFEVIPKPATRFMALRSGNIDIASLHPKQWAEASADEELMKRFKPLWYDMFYFYYIAWRTDRPELALSDARVRRAMAHAIDRPGIIEALFEGSGSVPATTFHPDSWAHAGEVDPWPLSPGTARELLEEAGWVDRDGDGIRERDGKPLSFSMLVVDNPVAISIAELVQAQLREVGVELVLDAREWSRMLETMRSRSYDVVMSGWKLDADPDPFDMWHSSQVDGGANYSGYQDPELDAWLEEARRTLDTEARHAIFVKIQERLHEQEPMTVLYVPRVVTLVDSRLEGVTAGPLGVVLTPPGPSGWAWSDKAP